MVSEGRISVCTVAILLADYCIYWQGLHQLPIASFNAVPKGEGIPHVILAERDYRKPEFLLPRPLLFFPPCLASLGTLKTSHKPSPQINWDILFYPCNVENARGHIQIASAYSTALIILKKKKILGSEQEGEAKSPQAVTRVSNPVSSKSPIQGSRQDPAPRRTVRTGVNPGSASPTRAVGRNPCHLQLDPPLKTSSRAVAGAGGAVVFRGGSADFPGQPLAP